MATEDPEPHQSNPHPQTLAAGELVWAKTKGRHHWWPARLHAPSTSAQPPLVSSLGAEYYDDHRPAADVKPFLSAPDADALARANTGLAFFAAVAHARATAVGILCDALTCHCARGPHPPPPADEAAASKVVITGVANLEPREFLAALGSAAVDAPGVGLLDHARLKSWVRALAQGWGPDGPGRYQRRTDAELADKIDLDILAEDGAASQEEEEEKNKPVAVPHKTPKQRRRRTKAHPKEEEKEEDKAAAHKTPKQRRRRAKASSLMESEEEDLSPGEEEGNASSQRNDESGTALSGRRERKKSKYLSPPYTSIGVFALEDKSPDSPKKSPPTSAAKKNERKNNKGSPEEKQQQKKNKVVLPPQLDNIGAQEVLQLVRCFGEDVSHKRHFPKAAEDFLGLLRSSVFAEGADHDSYKKHECPVARNAVANDAAADGPVAGLVSDSADTPKQGKGKRGRKKKDQDGSGDSSVKKKKTEKTSPTSALDCAAEDASEKKKGEAVLKRGRKKKEQDGSVIKRKKMDKTSPKATLGPGLVITPAIPIRQVSAEDIMSQVKPAGGAGMGVGVPDPKMKNNMLVSKSPISSIMSGGVKSGDEQDQGDGGSVVNAGGALSDQPTKKNEEEGTVEATEPDTDMNVDTLDGDVHVGSGAQAEARMPETGGIQVDMNVECVGVVDVPVTSLEMEAMVELEANIPLDINVQVAAVEDVPAATSGLLPPTHGDIAQPSDAVQESYTSLLKAMVPEMYKKVEEVAAGTGVVAAPQDEAKKVEQISSHSSPAKGTTTSNGSPCFDAPNSAQKRRNKKPAAYFANPAEIRVTFRDGTIVPTKEELLSEFRRFGVLVESECDISEDRRDARVVFAKSTEAEAAYTKAEIPGIFGQFGPPFATLGLNYLESITVAPARAAKPPLARADMRKNVENMISSLKNGGRSLPLNVGGGGPPVSESLLAEMQRLLSKLDKTQPPTGPSGSAP